jgi:hypothetical protein
MRGCATCIITVARYDRYRITKLSDLRRTNHASTHGSSLISASAPGTDITQTPTFRHVGDGIFRTEFTANGEKIRLTVAAAAFSSAVAAADDCIQTNMGRIMRDCSSAF